METPLPRTLSVMPALPARPSHPRAQRELMIQPRRLNFEEDDRTIISPLIPSRYLMRQIGLNWYQMVESQYQDVEVGTRILVRRDQYQPPSRPFAIIHDYMTVKVDRSTLYNGWVHINVAYPVGEDSPHPFDVDGYHTSEDLFHRHYDAYVSSDIVRTWNLQSE